MVYIQHSSKVENPLLYSVVNSSLSLSLGYGGGNSFTHIYCQSEQT